MFTLLLACASSSSPASDDPTETIERADVIAVAVDGRDGDWTFSVTISSPDTGCEQYADWWEVLSPEGALIFRRILNHSHPDEQPFTRSGSPVPVGGEEVIVRAHLSPGGYGGAAMQGSAAAGFAVMELAVDFATAVEDEAPQPEGCAF